MKLPRCCFLLLIVAIFFSCNKDEGVGGSSSIEGYVYNVVHKDDNFSFTIDTIPAVGEKVYIVYGNNVDAPVADKDVDTNKNGMYHFEYLRKGDYYVYALNSYPDQLSKAKTAEYKSVKVGSGTAQVENIYIHSGKAYGLSMIKGTIIAQYYDKTAQKGNPIPAVEHRVYLKRAGEDSYFDDVRTSSTGVFYFQKVSPGTYEVYTTTEDINVKNRILSTTPQTIEVTEAETVYELPNIFNIVLNI